MSSSGALYLDQPVVVAAQPRRYHPLIVFLLILLLIALIVVPVLWLIFAKKPAPSNLRFVYNPALAVYSLQWDAPKTGEAVRTYNFNVQNAQGQTLTSGSTAFTSVFAPGVVAGNSYAVSVTAVYEGGSQTTAVNTALVPPAA